MNTFDYWKAALQRHFNTFMTMENLYSYLTAKTRSVHSVPVRWLKKHGLLVGRILDYGCGRGFDALQLADEGYECEAYDPHFQPIMPTGLFDTIICMYVINVLEKSEQRAVQADVKRRLRVGGHAYFAVRRDIQREGWRLHSANRYTYQENAKMELPIIYQTHKFVIYDMKRTEWEK